MDTLPEDDISIPMMLDVKSCPLSNIIVAIGTIALHCHPCPILADETPPFHNPVDQYMPLGAIAKASHAIYM